jgi:hypothetical protein
MSQIEILRSKLVTCSTIFPRSLILAMRRARSRYVTSFVT